MKKKNVGSSLDSMLREDGIYEEVTTTAIKRVPARQIEAAMKERHFSNGDGAEDAHEPRGARPSPGFQLRLGVLPGSDARRLN